MTSPDDGAGASHAFASSGAAPKPLTLPAASGDVASEFPLALVDAGALCDGPETASRNADGASHRLDTVARVLACCAQLQHRLPGSRQLVFLNTAGYRRMREDCTNGPVGIAAVSAGCLQCVPFGCRLSAALVDFAQVRAADSRARVIVVSNDVDVVVQSRSQGALWRHQGFMFVDGHLLLPGLGPGLTAPQRHNAWYTMQQAPQTGGGPCTVSLSEPPVPCHANWKQDVLPGPGHGLRRMAPLVAPLGGTISSTENNAAEMPKAVSSTAACEDTLRESQLDGAPCTGDESIRENIGDDRSGAETTYAEVPMPSLPSSLHSRDNDGDLWADTQVDGGTDANMLDEAPAASAAFGVRVPADADLEYMDTQVCPSHSGVGAAAVATDAIAAPSVPSGTERKYATRTDQIMQTEEPCLGVGCERGATDAAEVGTASAATSTPSCVPPQQLAATSADVASAHVSPGGQISVASTTATPTANRPEPCTSAAVAVATSVTRPTDAGCESQTCNVYAASSAHSAIEPARRRHVDMDVHQGPRKKARINESSGAIAATTVDAQAEAAAAPLLSAEALLGAWVRDGGKTHVVVRVPGPQGSYLEFRPTTANDDAGAAFSAGSAGCETCDGVGNVGLRLPVIWEDQAGPGGVGTWTLNGFHLAAVNVTAEAAPADTCVIGEMAAVLRWEKPATGATRTWWRPGCAPPVAGCSLPPSAAS